MDYLSEEEIAMLFTNLLEIDSEIYDLSMTHLLPLEKDGIKNREEFLDVVKRINRLKVKERRVLEKITTSEYYYEFQDTIKDMIFEMCEEDYDKAFCLNERFENIFDYMFSKELAIEEVMNTIDIYDYIDDDYDFEEDGPISLGIEFESNVVDFSTPLHVKFLKYLKDIDSENEEYLLQKYSESFIYPFLENELATASYNLDNIEEVSNEVNAGLGKMELEEYEKGLSNSKNQFAESGITEFFVAAASEGVDEKKLDVAFHRAKFGILLNDTKTVVSYIKKYYGEDEVFVVTEDAIKYVERLGNDLLNAVFKREDYDENILRELTDDNVPLDNSDVKFSSVIYNDLFDLVNLSKEIYMRFAGLFRLDVSGNKEGAEFQEELVLVNDLMEKERELASELDFDVYEKDAAKEIISKYLNGIYALDDRSGITSDSVFNCQVIEKRIEDLLWGNKISDMSMYKDKLVPNSIIKNYQLECLRKFEEVIGASSNRDIYLGFKYIEIVCDAQISEEFILENGNIENAIILDDDITSTILDIDTDEYVFDREMLLSHHAYDIMQSFISKPEDGDFTSFENAYLDYQTIALDVALKYIDKESVDVLKADYLNIPHIDNTLLKKKLSKIFDKKEEKSLELSKKRH